jgi:hypothetical protein
MRVINPQRGAFMIAKLFYTVIFALMLYIGFEYARSVWVAAQAHKIVVEIFIQNREQPDGELQESISQALQQNLKLEVPAETVGILRSEDQSKVFIKVTFRHPVGLTATPLSFGIPKEIQVEESAKVSNPFR